MYALANCRISIYRGSARDEFGDPRPDNSPSARVAAGVLASITEKTSMAWTASYSASDQSTATPRVVRYHVCKVGSGVDVRTQDRVFDETHGDWFWVQTVTCPRAAGRVPDTEVELRRVTE